LSSDKKDSIDCAISDVINRKVGNFIEEESLSCTA
jgi:hypothetical protein